ncbi:GNAT family N-acetyltransferase [Shewanella sp. A14]
MDIMIDNLQDSGVIELLQAHLADMYATSPPDSVHALDIDALKHPSITFWCAKQDKIVLGCVAIKQLTSTHGEIKSMRTAAAARNRGIASALLLHILEVAQSRGYQQLSLETGSMDFFDQARRLYARHGFDYCGPFADYQLDPNSVFMTRLL